MRAPIDRSFAQDGTSPQYSMASAAAPAVACPHRGDVLRGRDVVARLDVGRNSDAEEPRHGFVWRVEGEATAHEGKGKAESD